jgi:alpha-D-ribose 1-methylphosphonate 5-triphosphate synthase subunit PhnH
MRDAQAPRRVLDPDGDRRLAAGFPDPVFDSQRAFRAVMNAMAEPGTIHTLSTPAVCPGFSPAMTAVALCLIDFETPYWSDASDEARDYLSFHTGAMCSQQPDAAAFAFLTRPSALASFAQFSRGTLDDPDRACTLVIEARTLSSASGWVLQGPGIPGRRRLSAPPLGDAFRQACEANRQTFPLGVDVLLCAGNRLTAVPRSTLLTAADGG